MRRIGIDVGGTNTDAVLIEDGKVRRAVKAPTSEDVTTGILESLKSLGATGILAGQRINGVVRVTDNPAIGAGRAYLVERELEQDGNRALQALVADYVEQAERHGVIPMHVPLGRYLAHIEE